MSQIVEVAQDCDFERIAEIRSLAFGDAQPYIDLIFPNHKTPDGRERIRDRLLKICHEDKTARFLVAKDPSTRQIISQAEWHVYDKDSTGDVMELDFVEGTEEEKAYATYIIGTFQAKRRAAIAKTQHPLTCQSTGLTRTARLAP